MDPDVPLMNPEANFTHLSLIDEQRRKRKWDGSIVTNPNCTTAILTLSLKPICDAFGLKSVVISSMQAASGAGYPGVASLDIIDNVIPFINGEEEKVQRETVKILGQVGHSAEFEVSASCHRVSVLDGHTEAVFVQTEKPADTCTSRAVYGSVHGGAAETEASNSPRTPPSCKVGARSASATFR